MPTAPYILRFSSRPEDFEPAFAKLRRALDQSGVHGQARHNAELVFEEVVSNLLRHGEGEARHIEVSVAREGTTIVLGFEDDGEPFDPLQHPAPVMPKSIEDAPTGGLGLLLVRKASSQLHYERSTDGKNRFIVTIAGP